MLSNILSSAKTIAVSGHVRPDGDCMGSVMAMYLYISENFKDKRVDAYLEDYPESFRFLHNSSDIRHEVTSKDSYDLFICLDCGDKERLGFSGILFENAKKTFCVDHHVSNVSFADDNYIFPEASSTCELVFKLFDKDKISKYTAEALYLGIVHDTGVFRYSNVSSYTLEAAAHLIKLGIDASKIINDTFYSKTFAQNKVLGKVLADSFLMLDGRMIVGSISLNVMEEYGVMPKDLDGIVSQLKVTVGVELAVFMYELDNGDIKVSLRSSDNVDSNQIAGLFGGGGHKKAAGFNTNGNCLDIASNIAAFASEQLNA